MIAEQTFGIHKKTVKILTQAPKYGIAKMTKIICATAGILNFMRGADRMPGDIWNISQAKEPVHVNDTVNMAELRETLVLQMWDAYVRVLQRRGQHPGSFTGVRKEK